MAARIEEPYAQVLPGGPRVPDLDLRLDGPVGETEQHPEIPISARRPPELARLRARRIALSKRRDELAVRRESLWSGILDLDEWRTDLAARCRATLARLQDVREARPPAPTGAFARVLRRASERAGRPR